MTEKESTRICMYCGDRIENADLPDDKCRHYRDFLPKFPHESAGDLRKDEIVD